MTRVCRVFPVSRGYVVLKERLAMTASGVFLAREGVTVSRVATASQAFQVQHCYISVSSMTHTRAQNVGTASSIVDVPMYNYISTTEQLHDCLCSIDNMDRLYVHVRVGWLDSLHRRTG